MDPLFRGKATAVKAVHRTVVKSRLSSPFWPREAFFRSHSLLYCPHALSFWEVMVGQNGLEPSTSRLSVVCSSQLSYWPISALALFKVHILAVPSRSNNANRSEHLA